MTNYRVYQQLPPRKVGEEQWESRLVPVAEIESVDGADAIAKARRLLPFIQARRDSLARYPIVEEV